MNVLVVVNHLRDLPGPVPGATVVSAREYLTDPAYSETRAARVLNLCRTARYQGRGYYVSLVAEARGHRPLPDVKTLGDGRSGELAAALGAGFHEQVQRALADRAADTCAVDAYFGRDPQGNADALAQQLFGALRVPLLRARFTRDGVVWSLRELELLGAADLAPEMRPAAAAAAGEYLARNRVAPRAGGAPGPALAILHNADEPDPPSNAAALEKFREAGEALGLRTTFLTRDELDRVSDFDALFIRDTTGVRHFTYQFARRAVAEGLVVIDDPDSILKCNNKVFLHELLMRHRIPTPKTLMVHRDNVDRIVPTLGLPCILKQPDGAFSRGVSKLGTEKDIERHAAELFGDSELVIAQEWLPTAFDWRVGVYDRRPLYVCKYFMAPGHWQVIKREAGIRLEGSTEALAVGEVPEAVVRTAVRAANLIGDGLYGVDLKEVEGQVYVIEVNDNPNVDAGNEDGVLQGALYREILGVFLRRIGERRRAGSS